MKRFLPLALAALTFAAAPDATVSRVHAWRMDHEREILAELFQFLSIPNVATDKAGRYRVVVKPGRSSFWLQTTGYEIVEGPQGRIDLPAGRTVPLRFVLRKK